MAWEVPYDDLRRDLMGCIIMYKNRPVYVTMINRDATVRIRDLFTQREDDVPFVLAEFSKPTPRIGFVNIMGAVVYMSRTPVRQYYMGIHARNTKVKRLHINYPAGYDATVHRAMTLALPEVAEAIHNRYPSIRMACQEVKRVGGAMAFDKQFAVDEAGTVYYKDTPAGRISLDASDINEVVWEDNKQHLSILLDGNYEKTVRDFRPAA